MLQFTNGFSCAADKNKEEIIFRFFQQIPEIGNDGKTKRMVEDEVVQLVMGKVLAQNLLDTLKEILETT